jgi:hypothetical protein
MDKPRGHGARDDATFEKWLRSSMETRPYTSALVALSNGVPRQTAPPALTTLATLRAQFPP